MLRAGLAVVKRAAALAVACGLFGAPVDLTAAERAAVAPHIAPAATQGAAKRSAPIGGALKPVSKAAFDRAVFDLARADLHFFTRRMFAARTGARWVDNWHHKTICDALTRVFRGECPRLIINIPPRYSKTEIAVVNFISWALGNVPDSEFIHLSYSSTLAVNNTANTRSLVTSQVYRETFPEVELSETANSKGDWKTTKGGVVYAQGFKGTITGFGAGKLGRDSWGGCILIDDPHKADEASSDTVRAGVIGFFQNTVESRKNDRRTPIIVIMQRLHDGDLSGWLLGDRKDGQPKAGGNGEVWEHLCIPAIQPDGTALWPAKHTIEQLRTMETASPYVFAGQYGQRPAPLGGGMFKVGMLERVKAIPSTVTRWVRGWDLAGTKDGDYTAGGKLGELADGRYIIAGMVRVREGPHVRDATMKNTAAADGLAVTQSLPQDPGQAGLSQVQYLTTMMRGYTVHSSPESGDKVTRADPFAAQVNVGNVLMLEGEWNEALTAELSVFPNGSYDDQVDALSRAFAKLQGPAYILEFGDAPGL